MQKKLSKQNNSGFTLSEVLIAVAILIVLMGLAMIPLSRHQRELRQTELDAKAETQKSRVKAEKTKIFFQKASSGFGNVSFKERSGRFKA